MHRLLVLAVFDNDGTLWVNAINLSNILIIII